MNDCTTKVRVTGPAKTIAEQFISLRNEVRSTCTCGKIDLVSPMFHAAECPYTVSAERQLEEFNAQEVEK